MGHERPDDAGNDERHPGLARLWSVLQRPHRPDASPYSVGRDRTGLAEQSWYLDRARHLFVVLYSSTQPANQLTDDLIQCNDS